MSACEARVAKAGGRLLFGEIIVTRADCTSLMLAWEVGGFDSLNACRAKTGCKNVTSNASHATPRPLFRPVLGSWGKAMRDAFKNKKRCTRRRTPTLYPSTRRRRGEPIPPPSSAVAGDVLTPPTYSDKKCWERPLPALGGVQPHCPRVHHEWRQRLRASIQLPSRARPGA